MKWKDWDFNLKLRLYGEGVMNILFWSFFPFMTIFFSDTFGKKEASILLIISQFFSVIANLVGGYCADRYGRKKMMVLSVMGQSISFVLFAAANSPWWNSPLATFIAFSLLSICGSFYWPASHAMVADVVDEKNRTQVFAVFYTAINIAVVVGPIIGGLVFFQYRFQMLLAGVIISAILAFVLSRYLRETAPLQAKKETKKRSWYSAIWDEIQDYKIIVNDKMFLLFILAGILIAQTFMQLDLIISVYMKDSVGQQTLLRIFDWKWEVKGAQAFSLVLATNGLLVALFTVYITKVMSKYKESRAFILSSCLYAIAISLFGFFTNVWVLLILISIFTLAELMVAGVQESFISKLAPDHMRGRYFSAASLRFTIGRLLAPISLAFSDWFSYQVVFILLGVLALSGAFLYSILFHRLEKVQPTSTT
ncbi:MFS transporter [Bacillaceae bacterium S4-13-58]